MISLYEHPFVLYAAMLYVCFMGSHTLEWLTKGRIKGMKYRDGYTYGAVAIILLNFVIKNVMRFVLGQDVLL